MKKPEFISKLSPKYFLEIIKEIFIFAPVCAVLSIITTFMLILLAEANFPRIWEIIIANASITLALGFLYYLNLRLFAYVKKMSLKLEVTLSIILGILLLFFYFSLPNNYNDIDSTKILVIGIAGLIFLLLAGICKNNTNLSYAYSILGIQRKLAESLLQLIIIYGGLASVLGTLHLLFDLKINDWLFIDSWILLSCIYFPFYFMHGLKEFYENDIDIDESICLVETKSVNILFSYIIIPLLMIYLFILYAYFVKVIFTWNWPKGVSSYLILAYSFVGLFSVIFMPLRNKIYHSTRLDSFYNKNFFIMISPLLIVFYLAVFKRIGDYGITEKRYLLLILAIWLTILVLYNLIKKEKKNHIIPISFTIFCFITIIGPWNMFNISKSSQLNRFISLCKANNLLDKKMQLIPSKDKISFNDKKSLSSILNYFNNNYRLKPLKALIPDSLYKENSTRQNMPKITKYLGFNYISKWQKEHNINNNYYFNSKNIFNQDLKKAKSIFGFTFNNYQYSKKKNTELHFDNKYRLKFKPKSNSFELLDKDSMIILNFSLTKFTKKLSKENGYSNYNTPQKDLTIITEYQNHNYIIILKSINYQKKNDKINITQLSGMIIEEE